MSNIINVAIVLIAIFIGLAVVCSFIQEQIAFALKQRGETLYAGHRQPPRRACGAFESRFGTARSSRSGAEAGSKPSYVEARNFSLSLWQNVHAVLGGTAGAKAAITVDAPKTVVANLATRVQAFTADDCTGARAPAHARRASDGSGQRLRQARFNRRTSGSTRRWIASRGWYKRWAQLHPHRSSHSSSWSVSGVDTIDTAKQLYTVERHTIRGGRHQRHRAPAPKRQRLRRRVKRHRDHASTNSSRKAVAARLPSDLDVGVLASVRRGGSSRSRTPRPRPAPIQPSRIRSLRRAVGRLAFLRDRPHDHRRVAGRAVLVRSSQMHRERAHGRHASGRRSVGIQNRRRRRRPASSSMRLR